MNLDEIDIKILKENFDENLINQIDSENVSKIFKYLDSNYWRKDKCWAFLNTFLNSSGLVARDLSIIYFYNWFSSLSTIFSS